MSSKGLTGWLSDVVLILSNRGDVFTVVYFTTIHKGLILILWVILCTSIFLALDGR